ncbi:hypothetical protein EZI54_18760 [Marinobacter halodurans]|uniref:Uncharacterized protein n=1 Tax=Marinobacter halodurans TaxID=2528979 RepID=A0ABY1ZI55_9GAMM|nr:hypothetical protein [Marinobacter halodurans]TBW49969.1 hypothetical protein EZI54_18760 [Marinobacter halodurans]
MVIRIFLLLLVLNSLAFVVKADAAERTEYREDAYDNRYAAQDAMPDDLQQDDVEAAVEVGSRLLQWRFSSNDDDGKRYASESLRADHGLALIDEGDGACLNLKWNF